MKVNENNEFKIQFHGACGRVTGSCYHLKFNHVQFLVDCGMVQGEPNSDWENAKPFPFNPSEIKYVYLTHAHIDHSGLIPRLIKEGFVGEVRCTSATKEVARYLLIDTAKIMEKQPETSILYSAKDVKKISWRTLDDEPGFKWGESTIIETDLSVVYNRQSHVLGSISLTFLWPRKGTDDGFESIHFSGDIGNNSQFLNGQALLKPRQNPRRSTSFLVSETTYGGRHHSKDHLSLDFRLSQLINHIDASIKNGKTKILIPAFAFHRTQEILFDLLLVLSLKDFSRSISVDYDSPLGQSISKVYAYHLFTKDNSAIGKGLNSLWLNDKTKDDIAKLKSTYFAKSCLQTYTNILQGDKDVEIRPGVIFKQSNSDAAIQIVISSSGMCDAGPILKHLKSDLFTETTLILLCGYQSKGTVGHELQKLLPGNEPEEENETTSFNLGDYGLIKLNTVKASIDMLRGYSGHADTSGVIDYLFPTDHPENNELSLKRTVFLTHGDATARKAFNKDLNEYVDENHGKDSEKFCDFKSVLPSMGQGWFDLGRNQWESEKESAIESLLSGRINALEEKMSSVDEKLSLILKHLGG